MTVPAGYPAYTLLFIMSQKSIDFLEYRFSLVTVLPVTVSGFLTLLNRSNSRTPQMNYLTLDNPGNTSFPQTHCVKNCPVSFRPKHRAIEFYHGKTIRKIGTGLHVSITNVHTPARPGFRCDYAIQSLFHCPSHRHTLIQ
jgi:hypothetical protein